MPCGATPPAHDAPSQGVLDRLQARALVLALGKQRIALVSLDLGRAPTRQSMAAIRARVRTDAGIEHLFVVASHTHHGPVLELDDWPTQEGTPTSASWKRSSAMSSSRPPRT